jgi:hypothetical protein
MKKNKSNTKGDINKFIEALFQKKMTVLEEEMKNFVLKTSEEYISNAIKGIGQQDNKNSLNDIRDSSLSDMNMSQSQVFGSLLSGINKYFDSM